MHNSRGRSPDDSYRYCELFVLLMEVSEVKGQ